ncbi:AAA family ATPase [Pantoea sp. BS_8]|uniref:AAA family ATPase n=1 Tax=Pantoea sp. BS_8 TaxID=3055781 RepID=UPI0035BF0748
MTDMTNAGLSPEKRLWLNAEEHVEKLTSLFRERKGHFYVQGSTGTGKSVVGRELAARLNGDYFSCELLTSDEYNAGLKEIMARLEVSDRPVIVLDGFFPSVAEKTMSHLLGKLRKKGLSLFVFSQEPLTEGGPDAYLLTREFNKIAELRYDRQSGSPVTLSLVQ